MKEIKLDSRILTIVQIDDTDYQNLIQYPWWRQPNKYGTIYAVTRFKNGESMSMHKMIMGPPPKGFTWDHKDRNGLNNQKNNLRIATKSQQGQNSIRGNSGISSYRGVSFNKSKGKWFASIKIDGKNHHLGYTFSELEAAKLYNEAAIKLHDPEFLILNEGI